MLFAPKEKKQDEEVLVVASAHAATENSVSEALVVMTKHHHTHYGTDLDVVCLATVAVLVGDRFHPHDEVHPQLPLGVSTTAEMKRMLLWRLWSRQILFLILMIFAAFSVVAFVPTATPGCCLFFPTLTDQTVTALTSTFQIATFPIENGHDHDPVRLADQLVAVDNVDLETHIEFYKVLTIFAA